MSVSIRNDEWVLRVRTSDREVKDIPLYDERPPQDGTTFMVVRHPDDAERLLYVQMVSEAGDEDDGAPSTGGLVIGGGGGENGGGSRVTEKLVVPEATVVNNVDEFVRAVDNAVETKVPNITWENIVCYGSTGSTYAIDNESETVYRDGYGFRNSAYFTDTEYNYLYDITQTEPMTEQFPPAWTDGEDGEPNPVVLTMVEEDGSPGAQLSFRQLTYTLNYDLMQKGQDGEITGLFLDFPSNDSLLRALVFNITSDCISENSDIPLYVRIESEPLQTTGRRAIVPSKAINVNGYQEKPLIITYGGPSHNRGLDDTPYINPIDGYIGSRPTARENLPTATTQSPPIYFNLAYDFNGVLYVPFSRVIITGPGHINGMVICKGVDDQGSVITRKTSTTSEIALPKIGSCYAYKYYDYYDHDYVRYQDLHYEVHDVTAQYTVVYDKLNVFECVEYVNPYTGDRVQL